MKSTYAPTRFETPQRRDAVDFGRKSAPRNLATFLQPITQEAAGSDYLVYSPTGAFVVQRGKYRLARYIGLGPASGDAPLRFAIFAGWRGDEEKSTEALLAFLHEIHAAPRRIHGLQIYAYPIVNPVEFEQAAAGERDLMNSLWRGSAWPEAYFLERELGTHQFHGIITLRTGAHAQIEARCSSEIILREVVLPPLAKANHLLSTPAVAEARPPKIAHPALTQELDTSPAPFELFVSLPATVETGLLSRAATTFLKQVVSGYRAFVSTHHHI